MSEKNQEQLDRIAEVSWIIIDILRNQDITVNEARVILQTVTSTIDAVVKDTVSSTPFSAFIRVKNGRICGDITGRAGAYNE